MGTIRAGKTPVHPPAPAPRGTRWSDVPAAVSAACDDPGVEMVVVQEFDEPDRCRFVLRTVEDWPGELVIIRGAGAHVCQVESAWIGRFPQERAAQERCKALVKAFETHLEAFGRKRGFE